MAPIVGPSEAQLQTAFLLAAPAALPDLRLFRRNVGAARLTGGHVVRFGVRGQCDLYAITKGGIHLELELKRHNGTISHDQLRWKEWCDAWSVTWILLQGWKGETLSQTTDRWVYEIREQL